MREDERALLRLLVGWHGRAGRPFVTDLGRELGLHPRRTEYLLEKWGDKGWWECGVSPRTGWFTAAGLEAARR